MNLAKITATTLLMISLTGTAFATSGAKAPVKGFRGEILMQLEGIEEKLVSLADAMPADKYDWRPGEGVRSVGEVYMHIASANYFLLSIAGVKFPEGIDPRVMEQNVKGKEKIIAALKESFRFAREQVSKMSDADLEKPLKVMGKQASVRYALMLVVEHNAEHLGQSIAYARSNGVVPPWSRGQN